MSHQNYIKHLFLFITSAAVIILGCSNTQALFDHQAYQQAVSLKVESLHLVNKATESFENHEEEVDKLKLELQKAYEYAKARPKNIESTQQWEIMLDPDASLIGSFLNLWEERGRISPTMVEQSKGNIGDGFDIIMELESGKRKQ